MQVQDDNKTAKIEKILKNIDWIKSQLSDNKSPLHQMYESKAGVITKWAEYLEDLQKLGAYEKPVNTISSHIKSELRKIGLEKAIPYVHEVLDFKYKSEYSDTVEAGTTTRGNPRLNSSLNIVQENSRYIKNVEKTIEFYKLLKTKLKTQSFCSLLDQTELDEYLLIWNELLEFAFEAWDNKQKVPLSTQHILAFCMAATTSDYGAGQYITHVKALTDLTPKQAIKILKGLVRDRGEFGRPNFRPGVLNMYNPKNRDQALHYGFYGTQCPSCGSWRVEYKYKGDIKTFENHCYGCGGWHKPKLVVKK